MLMSSLERGSAATLVWLSTASGLAEVGRNCGDHRGAVVASVLDEDLAAARAREHGADRVQAWPAGLVGRADHWLQGLLVDGDAERIQERHVRTIARQREHEVVRERVRRLLRLLHHDRS